MRRLRLPLLLAVLVAVSAVAVVQPFAAHTAGAAICEFDRWPVPIETTGRAFYATLEQTGIGLLRRGARVDTYGLQSTEGAWEDNPPDHPLTLGARVQAGFEVRWWTRGDDHDGVDVFEFASAAAARRYLAAMATAPCARGRRAHANGGPPGLVARVWTNPVRAREGDVLFVRGRIAFRVVVVPPKPAQHERSRKLIASAARLACEIPVAGCAGPPAGHGPTIFVSGGAPDVHHVVTVRSPSPMRALRGSRA